MRARRWIRVRLASHTASVAAAILFASTAGAANIAWVSFHAGDNTPSQGAIDEGYTQAPDVGYTNLLSTSGHTVTRVVAVNDIDLNATLLAQLNDPAISLVILSRSIDSAHYQTANEATAWNNTINKPMIVMGGYAVRNSRLGFVGNETIPDTAGPVKLTAAAPAHPVFAGVALDVNNTMVGDYSTAIPVLNTTQNPNTVQRGISVPELPIDAAGAGGTLIARLQNNISPGGNLVIAEWAAGTVITKDTGPQTLSNKRMVFLSGSREQAANGSSQQAGMFDLAGAGQTMFLNAVSYMGGGGFKLGDVDGDQDADMDDFNVLKGNFQKTVANRSQGDLNGDLVVDWKDFRQWKTAAHPAVAAAGTVPEPATVVLGLMAAAAAVSASRVYGRRA